MMWLCLHFSKSPEERRQEDIVQAVAQGHDVAVVQSDTRGVIRSWNAGATRIFGYTEDEALGKRVEILISPTYQSALQSITSTKGPRVRELVCIGVTKSGGEVPIRVTLRYILCEGTEDARAVAFIEPMKAIHRLDLIHDADTDAGSTAH